MNVSPALGIRFRIQLYEVETESLKGSHKMGDGRIFLKTSALLSLIKTFLMNLISAGPISVDSTFKNIVEMHGLCVCYHNMMFEIMLVFGLSGIFPSHEIIILTDKLYYNQPVM